MRSSNFSDEQLVAFLDGEAGHAPIADIEAALRADKALVQRLDRLQIDTGRVQAAFQSAIDPAKRPPMILQAANQNKWVRHAIAASFIGLLVGFGIGRFGLAPAVEGWKDYVAAYHSLYTTATIATVDNMPAMQQQELDRAGMAIGKQLLVSSLSALPDVDYKRAQILGFKDQPLLQLTFLTKAGDPIALCILKISSGGAQPVKLSTMEGMSAASWQVNGYDYLLIGGQNDTLLKRIANQFKATAI